jgi:hypothetical protein
MTGDGELVTTHTIAVNLAVHVEDQATAARVVEVLSRPLTGFALEGLYATLSVIRVEE